jgi:hypothetical protein
VFENLYRFILEVETSLFIEFKQDPFIFDKVPLMDMMFYVERIYNLLEDKYSNMDASDGLAVLLQRLL